MQSQAGRRRSPLATAPSQKTAPAKMAVPGLGSRLGRQADAVDMSRGAETRQQRHTTPYAPSWQASGDSPAPHRHFKGFPGRSRAPYRTAVTGINHQDSEVRIIASPRVVMPRTRARVRLAAIALWLLCPAACFSRMIGRRCPANQARLLPRKGIIGSKPASGPLSGRSRDDRQARVPGSVEDDPQATW
jgi:hypothetical protein